MAQSVARGASMRFPVVKGPLGCKRLRQGDVLPDIAEVSEVRVRHARTSLRSRSGLPPRRGTPHSRNFGDEIGRAHVELQSHVNLVCRLLLEKKNLDD